MPRRAAPRIYARGRKRAMAIQGEVLPSGERLGGARRRVSMTTTPTSARPAPSGSDHELERFVQQMRSTDVTLRSDAAHALGKLGDERAVPALAEALHDPDGYVRKSAVIALRRKIGRAHV